MPANFTALLSTPSEAEKALAKESSRQLAPLIQTERPSTSISVLEDELGQKIVIPNVAISLLLEILTQMAQGNAVTLCRAYYPAISRPTECLTSIFSQTTRIWRISTSDGGQAPSCLTSRCDAVQREYRPS